MQKKILLALGQGSDCLAFRKHFELWLYVILQVEEEKLSCVSPCQQRGMDIHRGKAGL